ncbi:MAG: phosphoribosylformylglycinamidine cyclo-ligase, partial [Steroidobacteraceae bacterium]|nr:phosphoribosylformylglycinamidine cyclo-ligase [Steroidobacteraceae bacterium]
AGSLPDAEMYRTFNCGIGMVAIVAERDTESALSLLRARGEIASVIGNVRRGDAGVVIDA